MKIVIENVSDGEVIPHNILLVRGRVDNLDSSLLEGKKNKNYFLEIGIIEMHFTKLLMKLINF